MNIFTPVSDAEATQLKITSLEREVQAYKAAIVAFHTDVDKYINEITTLDCRLVDNDKKIVYSTLEATVHKLRHELYIRNLHYLF